MPKSAKSLKKCAERTLNRCRAAVNRSTSTTEPGCSLAWTWNCGKRPQLCVGRFHVHSSAWGDWGKAQHSTAQHSMDGWRRACAVRVGTQKQKTSHAASGHAKARRATWAARDRPTGAIYVVDLCVRRVWTAPPLPPGLSSGGKHIYPNRTQQANLHSFQNT